MIFYLINLNYGVSYIIQKACRSQLIKINRKMIFEVLSLSTKY